MCARVSVHVLEEKQRAAMAAASHARVSEEDLRCPACTQLFAEPVALTCGHSFCLACVEQFWESRESPSYTCPTCREVFDQKPQLRRNVVIASMVKQLMEQHEMPKLQNVPAACGAYDLNETAMESCNDRQNEHPEPHCELCDGKFFKLCANCDMMCCETHSKSHWQKGHVLLDPGSNVHQMRCSEHGEMLKLYCKQDERLVCVLCMAGEHEHHGVNTAEKAQSQLKSSLAFETPRLSQLEERIVTCLKDLRKSSFSVRHAGVQRATEIEKKRKDLSHLVDEVSEQLQIRLDKQQDVVLSHLEQHICTFDKDLHDLQTAETNLQGALAEQDAITFLRGYKDLRQLLGEFAQMRDLPAPLDEIVGDFGKERHLDMLVDDLQREIFKSLYGCVPTLDVNTAHPHLLLSEDLRTVTCAAALQPYAKHKERFEEWWQVLATDGFSLGRHYWEVDLSQAMGCFVGVAYASIPRKGSGDGCLLGENGVSWCVEKSSDNISTWHDGKRVPLPLMRAPRRLGLLLDHDGGVLMYYDVGSMAILHVFQARFHQTLFPALWIELGSCVSFCSLE